MLNDTRKKQDFSILVVEDDNDINRLLATMLANEGYQVKQAYSGTEAMLLLTEDVQLVLLDLMLPGISGEEFLSRMRQQSTISVIVISGKSSLDDQVAVLRRGADDFIQKPFQKQDVLARVEAQLRRSQIYAERVNSEESATRETEDYLFQYRDLRLNIRAHELTWQDQVIELTLTEFLILQVLIQNPGKVFSREKLYQTIWDDQYIADDNSINVHISHLRQKLRQVCGEDLISTVWGIGYKLG